MSVPVSSPRSQVRELMAGESRLAHRAMQALRGAYQDEQGFERYVDEVLRAEGYRLVGAFAEGQQQAVAAAGFRVAHNLAWGHYLYVDDLSTHPSTRRQGHAGALLDWLIAEAQRLECDQLHLDSGTQAARFDAHRLYFNRGLAIHAHHFARQV